MSARQPRPGGSRGRAGPLRQDDGEQARDPVPDGEEREDPVAVQFPVDLVVLPAVGEQQQRSGGC